jgi:hypothetical protein
LALVQFSRSTEAHAGGVSAGRSLKTEQRTQQQMSLGSPVDVLEKSP